MALLFEFLKFICHEVGKPFVFLLGCLNVLNSANTYLILPIGFYFFGCSNFQLATNCPSELGSLANLIVYLSDWATMNLVIRFMGGVGFVLDYFSVVFVYSLVKKKRTKQKNVT